MYVYIADGNEYAIAVLSSADVHNFHQNLSLFPIPCSFLKKRNIRGVLTAFPKGRPGIIMIGKKGARKDGSTNLLPSGSFALLGQV